MSTLPEFGVCVPAYGSARELEALLASIRGLDYPADKLVVVVALDGPDTRLRAVSEAYGCTVAELPCHRGSYAARNAALARLPESVELVAFTDVGNIVDPQWLRAHVRQLEHYDLSGGAIRLMTSEEVTPAEFVDSVRHLDQERYVEHLGFAATANLAVRRGVLGRLRFDERLGSGGDRDFCNRAREQGHTLGFCPDAVVCHPARRTVPGLLGKARRIAKGTAAQRKRQSPTTHARSYRRAPLRAQATQRGLAKSVAWWVRVHVLDQICNAIWVLHTPASVPAAVARRVRARLPARSAHAPALKGPPHSLIIVENLPVPVDRRVWMEATTLRDAGWAVTVICPAGHGFEAPSEVREGITVLRHPLPREGRRLGGFACEYGAALWWEWRLTRKVWRTRGFEVLHVCNPPDLLFPLTTWFRLRHRIRVVFDQHDLVPEMYVAKYGRRGLLYRLLLLAERLTFASAHHVIATNESARSVALGRGGKDPADVTIVGSGPDPDTFRSNGCTDGGAENGQYLVAYAGIMGDQDGIDLLVQAVDHIVHSRGRRDVRFVAVGDGPARPTAESDARRRGLAPYLEFTGLLYGSQMLTRLSAADVCVEPEPVNGYSEYCTTNKVLEYMALGKPIVQFDRLEGRRSAGPAAWYATPNDPQELANTVLALLDDPEARRRMGTWGRERIERRHGWASQRGALLKAYDTARRRATEAATDAATRGVRRNAS